MWALRSRRIAPRRADSAHPSVGHYLSGRVTGARANDNERPAASEFRMLLALAEIAIMGAFVLIGFIAQPELAAAPAASVTATVTP